MALTDSQRNQLLELKKQGISKEQAFAKVFRNSTTPAKPEGRFADAGEDIKSSFLGAGEDLYQRGQNIKEGFAAGARGEQTPIETGAQMAGNVLGGAGDLAFRGIQAAVTPFMKQSEEEAITQGVGKAVEATGIPQAFSNTSERTQRNIIGGLGLFEGATAGVGSALTKPVAKSVTSRLSNMFSREAGAVPKRQTPEQFFAKTETRLNQIANDPELSAREKSEAAQSALSFRERMAGVPPDIKKRIQEMEPGTLERYFDQAHLRNINDMAESPYALGAQRANDAIEGLQARLSETGGEIGAARTKLATVKMPQNSVSTVEKAFTDELAKLNLTIRNGQVTTAPGKISKTASNSDINTIQDLYSDLLKYKQSPTLANAIDLRMKFDGKVKFGQSAREVSNSVDPLSRSTRAALANETAKTVGKSNAAEVQRYSDFIEAYSDLKSYTDRAAGGEYLLRLVLSGRGGEAQKLIQTVKEYTGIDLMNDATAMKLATDLIGNDAQKNLFRQEVTNAGLDAAKLFTGDIKGVGGAIAQKLIDYGINQEDIYRAIAAGTAGYTLMAYYGEDGMAPAGLAVLAAMPSGARKQALKQATDIAKSTGKTLKVSDDVRDGVQMALKDVDMNQMQTPGGRAGGSTIEFDDIDELERLQKGMETPGGLTDADFIEAQALLEKYNIPYEGKAQSATTETNLLEEAKKYESADEFVKAQETFYHGTTKKAKKSIEKSGFKPGSLNDSELGAGVYITNDRTPAALFDQDLEPLEVFIDDLKTYELPNFRQNPQQQSQEIAQAIISRDTLPPTLKGMTVDELSERIADTFSDRPHFWLEKAGYDGVTDATSQIRGQIAVFDPSKIKTRTQLEDIWKQANE